VLIDYKHWETLPGSLEALSRWTTATG